MNEIANKKVAVIGELHQDLFYTSNAYSELAEELANDILNKISQNENSSRNKDLNGKNEDTKANINRIGIDELRSTIIETFNRTSKKYSATAEIKRGGNGNNSATLLAKIGVPTALITVVGSGAEWMIKEVGELGIDTSLIFQKDYPTPISTIIEDPKVTKIFVANNLKKNMDFKGINLPVDMFKDVSIAFFTPMAFKYKELSENAVKKEVITCFTLELQKISTYNELEKCVTAQMDIMFANLDDAVKIINTNKTHENDLISLDPAQNEEKLEKVDKQLKRFAKIRVYTLGKYGSWILFENERLHMDVFNVSVKNRTGAGDTFAAGFISALYKQLSVVNFKILKETDKKIKILKECQRIASAAAALKVSSGMAPDEDEINKFLENNS